MAHLAETVSLGGTPFCLKHGSLSHTVARRYRTVSLLYYGAQLVGAEDDDIWLLTDSSNLTGQVFFGTCCIQTIDFYIDFTVDSASTKGIVEIYINNVLFDTVDNSAGTLTTETVSVDMDAEGLIGRPCGNIFEIRVTEEDGEDGGIAVSVSDVT